MSRQRNALQFGGGVGGSLYRSLTWYVIETFSSFICLDKRCLRNKVLHLKAFYSHVFYCCIPRTVGQRGAVRSPTAEKWTIKRGQECPVSKREAWKEQTGGVTAGGRDRPGLLTLSPVKLETGAFVENLFWFCKHADESHPRP